MRGTTLIEMVVTLAILGLLAGMAAVSFQSLRPRGHDGNAEALDRARASAIHRGRAAGFVGESGYRALLLPDGRVIGPGVDPLTGQPADARR